MKPFNYEEKIWGVSPIKPNPFHIQGLKLTYVLRDLQGIRGNVLEVGCGGGNMLRAISESRKDIKLYGVDISKSAIVQAKKNSKNIRFYEADVYKLPFKDNFFSAVIAFDVLEHIENPEKALKEIRRVLNQGGIFHVFSPLDVQPGTLHSLLYKFGWKAKDKHTGHVQWFSDKSFCKLLKKNGFSLIAKRFSFHIFLGTVDALYYQVQEMLHLKPKGTLEDTLKKRKTLLRNLLHFFYTCTIAIGFYESRLLANVPGEGGHYLFIKS